MERCQPGLEAEGEKGVVSLQLFLLLSLLLLCTFSLPLTLRERLKLWKAEQSQLESERKGEKLSLTWPEQTCRQGRALSLLRVPGSQRAGRGRP